MIMTHSECRSVYTQYCTVLYCTVLELEQSTVVQLMTPGRNVNDTIKLCLGGEEEDVTHSASLKQTPT